MSSSGSLRPNDHHSIAGFRECFQGRLRAFQDVLDLGRRAVSCTEPDNFGRTSSKNADVVEIAVFGDDHESAMRHVHGTWEKSLKIAR